MVLKKDGDTALALALLAQYITQVEPPHLNSSTSTILLAYTCIHMPIPSSSSQLTQLFGYPKTEIATVCFEDRGHEDTLSVEARMW
jgi:hypothetical protein